MRAKPPVSSDPDGALVRLLDAATTEHYLPRLIELAGGLVPHDRITVTRYSTHSRPEFLTHRNFSDDLVRRYLAVYYPFDPFYAHWCRHQTPGVIPLARFGSRELKQGRYIAEFLAQSVIRDEVGILLDDGPSTTLGIFLERAATSFSGREVGRLERAFPILAAVHALHRRVTLAATAARHIDVRQRPSQVRRARSDIPAHLWPDLTRRERELVSLILAGHPPLAIAASLGISSGTVRNHRQSIFRKLDITTEREIFLQYLDFLSGASQPKAIDP